ncbi:alpha/beta fold hydrolase [Christensenellaceae bacterium OttesenSCG-928-M15]|nr:alpha/beta fold hydrolase [Christensenellaceae bacterium OttesenSCG-928-M15]
MSFKNYIPTGQNVGKRRFFDSLADPFYNAGSDVGCVVLHGFTGTPANVLVVARALAEEGFSVYAPLLSGHGTTLRDMDAQNEDVWIKDALAAYERLKKDGCKRIYMMGLSMGGLLSAMVAGLRECAGLVLMSTPFKMRQYLHKAGRISGVLPYILFHGETRYQLDSFRQGYSGAPLRKLVDLERLSLSARGGLYKITCPLLVLQSKNDKRVDMTSVEIAMNGVKSAYKRHVELIHSPHGCSFGPEKELVAQYCVAFVKQQENMVDKEHGLEALIAHSKALSEG